MAAFNRPAASDDAHINPSSPKQGKTDLVQRPAGDQRCRVPSRQEQIEDIPEERLLVQQGPTAAAAAVVGIYCIEVDVQ